MVQTLEARSIKEVSKDEVLRLIVQHIFQQARMPVFYKATLPGEQEWALVEGTIGERGGGKSATDAVLAIVDNMIFGRKCYSNMTIACEIEVDDDTARHYGLNNGGVVEYKAEKLKKDALLRLDDQYRNAALVIEEINVEYSNARRFMTNTNVDFNEVVQQLRKLETNLLFNVIDEMFIDSQLRALSDIFIKTYDSAFDVNNMANRKARGLDFMWSVYPMSAYLRGEQGKYAITKKPLDPVCFHFAAWRGIYNSKKHQQKGIYSISTKDKNKKLQLEMSVESSEEMTAEMERWGWLGDMAVAWKNQGVKELTSWDLASLLGKPLTREIKEQLPAWGILWDNKLQVYRISDYTMGGKRRTPTPVLV